VHADVTRFAAVIASLGLALASLMMIAPASPADAAPTCPLCGDVDLGDEGLLARARSQMAELNRSAANPQPCTDESHDYVIEDTNDTVEYHGFLRWRPSVTEQDVWDDDSTTTMYRHDCDIPPLEPGAEWLLEGGLVMFDAISPQTISRVAVDDALEDIPGIDIQTNPRTQDALVAISTWFWVTGVPEGGVTAEASVPGISVRAVAEPGAVRLDLDDGTSITCPGGGVPYSPGASSDCTHEYQRAGTYMVSATVLWTGTYTYTVDGLGTFGPFEIQTPVPRTDSSELAVNEAQAINTRSGG
jgi:hypothetical protein